MKPHFMQGMTIQKKRLDPDKSGNGIQQVIATILNSDGLKVADVYDTAFPEQNDLNCQLILNSPEMYETLEKFMDCGLIASDGSGSYTAHPELLAAIESAKKFFFPDEIGKGRSTEKDVLISKSSDEELLNLHLGAMALVRLHQTPGSYRDYYLSRAQEYRNELLKRMAK